MTAPAAGAPKATTTKTPNPKDLTGDDPDFDAALTELAAEGALDDEPVVADEPEPIADPAGGTDPVGDPISDPDPTAATDPLAVPTPDAPAAPATPAVDPLADTAPLDYALDGQSKTFDGILIDKTNGAAFILPDKLEAVRGRLIEADRATAQVQQLSAAKRDYDELAYRFATKDATGKEQQHELKGFQAFEKLTADVAGSTAAGLFLMKTLLEAFPGEQDKAALIHVFKQAEFEHRRVSFEAQQRFHTEFRTRRVTERTTAQTATNETTWFANAIGQYRKAFPILTDADIAAGQQFFAKRPQLVYRNATAQDAAKLGVRMGERIADPDAMNEWYTERAASRAQQNAADLARVTATGTAGKHNAGMDKGRQAGKLPARARGTTSAPPATTTPERVSRNQQWVDPLTEALAEMGITD